MYTPTIDPELKTAAPDLTLGVCVADVIVKQNNDGLWQEIDQCSKTIRNNLSIDTLAQEPAIQSLRKAYRALGKDPARYRSSAEALVRRILHGKPLYRVNNIVDINNLVSLELLNSIGTYDADTIEPPITFRVGEKGETYEGIGKGVINIEELPVLADTKGAFGSPTSDSDRTKITEKTHSIILNVIAFNGKGNLDAIMKRTSELLVKFADAKAINIQIIS